MNTAKGAIKFSKYVSITHALSAEVQRNGISKNINKPRDHHYYDLSRLSLNFEVYKGHIMPRLTSGSLVDKQRARWEALDYRPMVSSKTHQPFQNGIASFILGGNVDVMRKLAFGDQHVDYTRDDCVDNSHVVRHKLIEQWALDCYKWIAESYGEDNIVGCDVHLDENSPHMHVFFIPIVERKGKYTVSVSALFGHPYQIAALHDMYYANVGSKYGLMRGDEPTSDIVNSHLSLRDYIRQKQALEKEIENLTAAKDQLENQTRLRTPKFKF